MRLPPRYQLILSIDSLSAALDVQKLRPRKDTANLRNRSALNLLCYKDLCVLADLTAQHTDQSQETAAKQRRSTRLRGGGCGCRNVT